MDIAVVGGGLGGLVAASLAARGGARVTIYERSAQFGGRARSSALGEATVNLGAHALYCAGHASRILRSLGVNPQGKRPPPEGWLLRGGRFAGLPATPLSLLTSPDLDAMDKLALSAFFAPWGQAPDVTVGQWLAAARARVREVALAAFRVATYANAPELQSARVAQAQVRLATRGVLYLDGGWQSLVDGVRGGLCSEVRVAHEDVTELPPGDVVILATSPAHARALGVTVPALVPVRAAALDLVMDAPPDPARRFVLGVDETTYFADHGTVARLGGQVVHLVHYLPPGPERGDSRAVLEALLDAAWPGWRGLVKEARFLPNLTVTHRLDEPGQRVEGHHLVGGRRVAVVGDWVGERGLLLDRSLASAEAAVAWALSPKTM